MNLSHSLYKFKRRYGGCKHNPDHVVADILDGDFHGGPGGIQAVQWCRRCGAYRRCFTLAGSVPESLGLMPETEWRIPSRWWDR